MNWKNILSCGILPLARLIAESLRKRQERKERQKMELAEKELAEVREKLAYQRFVERERLKQRDAAANRGRHKTEK
jgi:hypothetical protein